MNAHRLILPFEQVLVRTESGDALKRLTGIMSDTVLKDCAEQISQLSVSVDRIDAANSIGRVRLEFTGRGF